MSRHPIDIDTPEKKRLWKELRQSLDEDISIDKFIFHLIQEDLMKKGLIKKKILILFLAYAFLFSFLLVNVSADPSLSINPLSLSTTVFTNVPKQITLTFTNTGNNTLNNLTMFPNSVVSFNKINSLSVNQSVSADITVSTTTSFIQQHQLRFTYTYVVNTTINPSIKEINITDNSISPSTITIRQGDTIRFKNIGTVDHSIIADDNSFNDNILVSGYVDKVFNTISSINYHLTPVAYTGTIDVITNIAQSSVNNPNLDKYVTLDITSIVSATNITIAINPNDLTIKHNETKETVVSITNTGNFKAENLKLTADWMQFSKTNFNLDSGQTTFVTASIRPAIIFTNQTEKNYTKAVTLTGNNINSVSADIRIFIPFQDLGEFSLDQDLLNQILAFCSTHPTSLLCGYIPQNATSGNVIYLYKNYSAEFTPQQIESAITGIPRLENAFDRSQAIPKQLIDEYNNNLTPTLFGQAQEIKETKGKLDILSDEWQSLKIAIIIAMVVISIAVITTTIILLNSFMKKKSLHQNPDQA